MTQILSAPSTLSSEVYDERIATRSARVGIVGLGYAGLPLAMAFAEAGFDVVGIDLNRERVAGDRRLTARTWSTCPPSATPASTAS